MSSGIYQNLTLYGDREFSRYMRNAFLASAGYDEKDLERPVVGIADTSSDYNPCHRHMKEMIEAVKRGVLEAGGLPMVFPTISLHEILISPTSMLYRNLMAMETEEMLHAYPMDSVILMGGCDKTLPAQLMAALSADMPALCFVTGPMSTGYWRGERLGACTDCRRQWARFRAGEIGKEEIQEIQSSLCSTSGTCMVMGTASSMACVTEAMGMMLPYAASAPCESGERLRIAVASGRKAVELATQKISPRSILTRSVLEKAIYVLMALGGSTNVVIHLTAIARRAGIPVGLDDFQKISKKVPLLVDCKPSGKMYMEDFHHAGGVPELLKVIAPLLEENAEKHTPPIWQTVIRSLDNPLGPCGSLSVVRGSLAPQGALIKKAAASPSLLHHKGPAIVFESPEDVSNRIDDPSLQITPDHIMVMRNAGPIAAGMPEAGSWPLPKYLASAGIKDMVRISDARMSGTSYGTVVLHCSPESAAGGPLAFVQNGDTIELDVDDERLDLLISKEEMTQRKKEHAKIPAIQPSHLLYKNQRGWKYLYARHVLQADQGADLDFLT